MPWHHIIPKHEWKKRFGNLTGVNAKDNVVNLSLENHQQIHKRYGEEGSEFDRIAGLTMLKQIGKEDARILAVRFALSGKPKSLDHIKKMRLAHAGKRSRSLESYREQSDRFRGAKLECPHCSLVGGRNVMRRWHFNNCKKR
jgi:hypothetical protein